MNLPNHHMQTIDHCTTHIAYDSCICSMLFLFQRPAREQNEAWKPTSSLPSHQIRVRGRSHVTDAPISLIILCFTSGITTLMQLKAMMSLSTRTHRMPSTTRTRMTPAAALSLPHLRTRLALHPHTHTTQRATARVCEFVFVWR